MNFKKQESYIYDDPYNFPTKKSYLYDSRSCIKIYFKNSMKIHYNLYCNFKSEKFYQHCIKSSSKN